MKLERFLMWWCLWSGLRRWVINDIDDVVSLHLFFCNFFFCTNRLKFYRMVLCGLKCCKCFIYPLQNGYIDGPIVNTFRTNLVVLPTVLEYLQYILIGLGLATIIIAAVVYRKVKVKLPHRIQASMLSCLTARCILGFFSSLHQWKKRSREACPEAALIEFQD